MDVASVMSHTGLWTAGLKPDFGRHHLVVLETEVTMFGKEDDAEGESCDARQ